MSLILSDDMPSTFQLKYKIWHGECQSFKDAKSISADSPKDAIERLFKLKKEFIVVDAPNGRWIAINKLDNSDYYFILNE